VTTSLAEHRATQAHFLVTPLDLVCARRMAEYPLVHFDLPRGGSAAAGLYSVECQDTVAVADWMAAAYTARANQKLGVKATMDCLLAAGGHAVDVPGPAHDRPDSGDTEPDHLVLASKNLALGLELELELELEPGHVPG
jgi:hypothetical protein